MFINNEELKAVKTISKKEEDINIYQYKNSKISDKFYICIETLCGSVSKGLSNRYAEYNSIEDAIVDAELFLNMINDVKEGKII